MNTNMADGAAQRLVAEMGQRLFGQPGLNLMELAEKVKGMQPSPAMTALGLRVVEDSTVPPGTFEIRQPSSPGQGDMRAQFEAWAHAQSHRGGNIITDRDAENPDVYACPNAQLTWQCWKAALAARQPVAAAVKDSLTVGGGQAERRAPVQGYHGGTIPWRVHGLAWEAYAKQYGNRQTAERLAERGGFGVKEMDMFLPGWRDMAEGSPAQAVDLGQFRDLARSWIVEAGGAVADTKHACADELLALIDSKAVGNG